jgi:hypothetical protein
MEIVELVENEDGSCTCRLSLNSKEAEALISVGFSKLMLDFITEQEKIPALLKEKQVG